MRFAVSWRSLRRQKLAGQITGPPATVGTMEFEFLVQAGVGSRRRAELNEVRTIALSLRDALADSGVSEALARIAPIGGTSHAVDAVVRPVAESFGFTS